MINIFDTAYYILENIGGSISTMLLQKLCYYCQAWHLVWHDGEPLFAEDFKRFDGGPVSKELFDLHKGLFYIDKSVIKKSNFLSGPLSDKERRTVEQIIEDYGKYTGSELSEISHMEDPWKYTPKDAIISKKVMFKYYSSLNKMH